MKRITLYKYMSLRALTSFLKYHNIKLSFGYEANDCFEMLQGNLIPSATCAEREKLTQTVYKHGFVSLTSVKDNPYMWGYYAEQYKGACLKLIFDVEEDEIDRNRYLRLDKEKPRFAKLTNIENIDFEGAYIEKCEYEINRADKVVKALRKCTQNIISNKHVTWSHEEEYRIIYSTTIADRPNTLLDMVETGTGLIYTTKDLNLCAVSLQLGPLCPVSLNDAKLAMNADAELRGIGVERAEFSPLLYSATTPSYYGAYEEYLTDEIKNKLNKNGVCPIDELKWNTFLAVAKYGDRQLMENIYEASHDVIDSLDIYGNNALDIAIRGRSKNCIDFLLSKGLKHINLKKEEIQNAIFWCVQHDFETLLKFILENNFEFDINAKDKKGRNAIMIAARNNSIECFKLLQSKLDREIINSQDLEGRTALMLAALSKNDVMVDLLLKEGADVQHKDYDNSTALFFAVASTARSKEEKSAQDESSSKIISLLLSNGANVKHKEDGGRTALMYAAYSGFAKSVEILVAFENELLEYEDENHYTALMYSIKGNDRIIPKLLPDNVEQDKYVREHINDTNMLLSYLLRVNTEFDVSCISDDKDKLRDLFTKPLVDGLNFIAIAAKENRLDAIKAVDKYLTEEDYYKRDKSGCTPIMWSVYESGNNDVLKYLCEKLGIKSLKDQDEVGCNVLMWAARKGNVAAITYIMTYIKNHERDNPDFESYIYLLEQDRCGMTALMWAAWKDKHEVVQRIINIIECYEEKRGFILGDVLNMCDNSGKTAFDYACEGRHVEVIKNLALSRQSVEKSQMSGN